MVQEMARADAGAGRTAPIRLLVSSPAPVRSAAIQLQGLRECVNVQIDDGFFVESPDAFLEHAMDADWIVVTSSAVYQLPGPQLGDAFQQAMEQSGEHRLVERLPGLGVRPVEIFVPFVPAGP